MTEEPSPPRPPGSPGLRLPGAVDDRSPADPSSPDHPQPGRMVAAPRARRRIRPAGRVGGAFAAVVAAWIALDQVTKEIAVRVWGPSPVDLGFIRLVDVRNPNAAFGIPGFPLLFVAVTVVVTALVVRALPTTDRYTLAVAYGLVVGGAIGNAIDRVVRPGGAVVDFLDLGWWPVFNVADSGITVGAVALVLLLGLVDREERAAERERVRHRSVRPDPQTPRQA